MGVILGIGEFAMAILLNTSSEKKYTFLGSINFYHLLVYPLNPCCHWYQWYTPSTSPGQCCIGHVGHTWIYSLSLHLLWILQQAQALESSVWSALGTHLWLCSVIGLVLVCFVYV